MAGNNKRKFIFNEDPKQRMIYAWIGATLVASIGLGYYFINSGGNQVQEVGGARVVSPPEGVSIKAGVDLDPMYRDKVEEDSKRRAEIALESGKSYVPIIVGKPQENVVSPLEAIPEVKPVVIIEEPEPEPDFTLLPEPEPVPEPEPEPEPEPVVEYEYVPISPTPVVYEPQNKPRFSYEDTYIIQSLMRLQTAKLPASEFNYMGQPSRAATQAALSEELPTQSVVDTTGRGAGATAVANKANEKEVTRFKAGDILYAVLETGINSKEPSPVMAKIVSGELKGTRLIGSLGVTGKKVVLQFNNANIPGQDKSVAINAVAVDPETSRTALASEVNNHYFSRYGLLIASSFLSGWADAIANSNRQTNVGPFGNVIVTPNDNISNKDIMKEAIGRVGDGLSDEARRNMSSLTPTIKVNSGVAIGILLMSDMEF